MYKRIRYHASLGLVFVSLLASAVTFLAVGATEQLVPDYEPSLRVAYAQPPEVSAAAVIIADAETGAVVYEKRADDVLPVASVTKLVAAAALLETEVLDASVTVSAVDTVTLGRSGRLEPGQVYTRRELLFPLLLESSNDAAAALARTAAGDLVAAMNTRAVAVGASSAQFVDASGLSDKNQASARDLLALMVYISAHHRHLIDITTLSQYLNHVNAWKNNSPVFNEVGYAGGKHGYTEAAGRTLVAQFDEELGSGERRFHYVVLGSADLAADIAVLRRFTVSAVRFE